MAAGLRRLAAPVRIGNAAHGQLQLDVFGEVMDALHQARCNGLAASESGWAVQLALLAHLERVWTEPDEGIWEVRGSPRHFTYSKVMAWVAFDRAIKSAEEFGLEGPVERWRAVAAEIHDQVCRRGFDPELGSFVQSYGSKQLDASLLLLPSVGFLPPDEPRMLGTLKAIEQRLLVDGFVRRYDIDADDGLPPGEGVFLACSFWLVDAYILQKRFADARALFDRLLALRNDVGLLSEEYDPAAQRLVGNFPQAFTHVALVNSAFNLTRAEKPAEQRAAGGGAKRLISLFFFCSALEIARKKLYLGPHGGCWAGVGVGAPVVLGEEHNFFFLCAGGAISLVFWSGSRARCASAAFGGPRGHHDGPQHRVVDRERGAVHVPKRTRRRGSLDAAIEVRKRRDRALLHRGKRSQAPRRSRDRKTAARPRRASPKSARRR